MTTIMEYKNMLNNQRVSDQELRAMWDENPRFRQVYLESQDSYFDEVSVRDFKNVCDEAALAVEKILNQGE